MGYSANWGQQALYYSIPGVGLGVVIGFLLNAPIAWVIASFSATDVDLSLTTTSLGLGVALGIIMPFFANIIPIRVGNTFKCLLLSAC